MNTNYNILKNKAARLRKKGFSYNEIKKEIPVSKSTLSLWLKNIVLKPKHKKRLYTKQIEILSRGPQSQKERRMKEVKKITEKAEKEIKIPLSKNTYKLFGAALYWAEGSKSVHFSIANSDPYFIIFMVKWFETVFGVATDNLKAHLNIHPQQNDNKLKKFWSDLTGIPLKNFGKSFIKPPNKGYKKNNLYYGTIKIRVLKGTDMRLRVFGWIKALLKDVKPQVEFIERRWETLKQMPRPINLNEN